MNDFIAADSRILQDPAPFMGLSELADSSVNLQYAFGSMVLTTGMYFFEMNEKYILNLQITN
jgi:small conductance mechanosensitive channel